MRSRPLSIGHDDHPADPAWWFERELEVVLALETQITEPRESRESGRSTEPA